MYACACICVQPRATNTSARPPGGHLARPRFRAESRGSLRGRVTSVRAACRAWSFGWCLTLLAVVESGFPFVAINEGKFDARKSIAIRQSWCATCPITKPREVVYLSVTVTINLDRENRHIDVCELRDILYDPCTSSRGSSIDDIDVRVSSIAARRELIYWIVGGNGTAIVVQPVCPASPRRVYLSINRFINDNYRCDAGAPQRESLPWIRGMKIQWRYA